MTGAPPRGPLVACVPVAIALRPPHGPAQRPQPRSPVGREAAEPRLGIGRVSRRTPLTVTVSPPSSTTSPPIEPTPLRTGCTPPGQSPGPRGTLARGQRHEDARAGAPLAAAPVCDGIVGTALASDLARRRAAGSVAPRSKAATQGALPALDLLLLRLWRRSGESRRWHRGRRGGGGWAST